MPHCQSFGHAGNDELHSLEVTVLELINRAVGDGVVHEVFGGAATEDLITLFDVRTSLLLNRHTRIDQLLRLRLR